MNSLWQDNKQMLWGIIKEQLNNTPKPAIIHVHNYYEEVMKNMFKKQYDYSTITQLNKDVIKIIYETVQNIKNVDENNNANNVGNNSLVEHTPHHVHQEYSKEAHQKKREIKLRQQVKEQQKEFDSYNNTQQKQIDFSDKLNENEESIDTLLEREMNKRKTNMDTYELTNKSNVKQAESWINSGRSQGLDINKHSSIKLVISDESNNSKPINKKVRFENVSNDVIILPSKNVSNDVSNDVISSSSNKKRPDFMEKLKLISNNKEKKQNILDKHNSTNNSTNNFLLIPKNKEQLKIELEDLQLQVASITQKIKGILQYLNE